MRGFEFVQVTDIDAALSLLSERSGTARVLAGGTDLVVQMKEGRVAPDLVIDLKSAAGLQGVLLSEHEISIGAMVVLSDLEKDGLIWERVPALAEAAATIGSPQIRNLATVGGNLCNASPSADMAPALLALNARVEIRSARGNHEFYLDSFFRGPSKTVLTSDEILSRVLVPLPAARSGCAYVKLGRRKGMDLALVGVAAYLELAPASENQIQLVRIGLGAVAPTPLRAVAAEAYLADRVWGEDVVEEAARVAAGEARPITDLRASAEYRREMVRVLTRRALVRAYEQALRVKEVREPWAGISD